MDGVEEGPNGRKPPGVRTPGAAGDKRWGFLTASTARRAGRGSRGRVRGAGDGVVGKEVQALEDGGHHGRVGDHADDPAPAVASKAGQEVNQEHPAQ